MSNAHALESVLAFANPATASGATAAVSAHLHYFLANDPLSVSEYQDKWQGAYHPRDGRNVGLMSQRADIAFQLAGWRLGAFQRREALIDSNRDATDLVHLYKTRGQVAAGQLFAVSLNYQAYDAMGWRVDKAWQWQFAKSSELTLGIGCSILEGRRVRAGAANGSVTSLGAGKYNYALGIDDADTRKTYPFQTPGEPEGRGQAWDLGLSLKTHDVLRLELLVNDLLANIRWRDIPSTVANANSGVTTTDANGYIIYTPALSGRNSRRNFTQTLPVRWFAGAEASPWKNITVSAGYTHQENLALPQFGAAWEFLNGWQVAADYDTRFGSTGVKLTHPLGFVALRTNQWSLSSAGAYGISAALRWAF